jgi:hypothetical protein
MSLFANLFSLKVQEKPSGRKEILVLVGTAKFEQEVTVEEQHQAVLEVICGPRKPRGVNRFETARLTLEEKNPQAINAVRVEMRGKPVGYLSPEDAIRYRRYLIAKDMPHATGECQAVIRGGWVSSDGRKGPYEVWLDFPTLNQ